MIDPISNGYHNGTKFVYGDDLMPVFQSTGLFSIRDVLPDVKCEKVLCFVGSAEVSDPVVEVAKTFAAIGSEPCHVVLCLDPDAHRADPAGRACTPLTPEVICRAKEQLKALYGSDVHTVVLPGHPVREIRRYARNHKVDLIVVGRQGRDTEESCGDRIPDGAPCAVLSLILPLKEEPNETHDRN
jgi:nucleotide-binding universal stress UspA family protein